MQTFFRANIGSCTFDAVPCPEGVIVLVWTDPKAAGGPEENEVSVAEAREMIAAIEAAVAAVVGNTERVSPGQGGLTDADLDNLRALQKKHRARAMAVRRCRFCPDDLRFKPCRSESSGGKLFGYCEACGGRNEITAAEQREIHLGKAVEKFSPVGPPLP